MSLVAIAKKNVAKARVNETELMTEIMKKLKTDLKGARKITKGTIEFLLDCSGSMDEGEKLAQAKRGIISFATEAKSEYLFELISFSDETSLICSWDQSSQIKELKERIEKITASSSTCMAKAIQFAANRLDETSKRIIVIATDGKPNDPGPEETLEIARRIKSSGINIIAIGTDGANENFLRRLASQNLGQKVERKNFGKAIATSMEKIKALPA